MMQEPDGPIDVTEMLSKITKKQSPPRWREIEAGLGEVGRRAALLATLPRVPTAARNEARIILEIVDRLRRR